jgi:hypothetical protein
MNKKFLSILAIVIIFAITAVISAMTISKPRAATAKSTEAVSNFNENADISTPINIPASNVEYPIIQDVSGVKMEVTGTSIETIEGSEGKYFSADVCYNFPSQKTDYEFILGSQTQNSITLTTANETIQIYSWKIISGYNEDVNGNFQGNCARLYFPVSSSTNLDNLTLTISRMSTPVADLPDCNKAQKKLDDAKQEIKVICYEGGGFGVSKKPDNMSEQEARVIALDAFIDIVEGTWVFKLK